MWLRSVWKIATSLLAVQKHDAIVKPEVFKHQKMPLPVEKITITSVRSGKLPGEHWKISQGDATLVFKLFFLSFPRKRTGSCKINPLLCCELNKLKINPGILKVSESTIFRRGFRCCFFFVRESWVLKDRVAGIAIPKLPKNRRESRRHSRKRSKNGEELKCWERDNWSAPPLIRTLRLC